MKNSYQNGAMRNIINIKNFSIIEAENITFGALLQGIICIFVP